MMMILIFRASLSLSRPSRGSPQGDQVSLGSPLSPVGTRGNNSISNVRQVIIGLRLPSAPGTGTELYPGTQKYRY